jgi:hypothetical protein
MLGYPAEDEMVKQEIDHILVPNLAGDQYGQALPRIFIYDIQYFEGFAISRTVCHEIVAPDMVLVLRS